eukprot:381954-Pyramimonas_sp.AAC.1
MARLLSPSRPPLLTPPPPRRPPPPLCRRRRRCYYSPPPPTASAHSSSLGPAVSRSRGGATVPETEEFRKHIRQIIPQRFPTRRGRDRRRR